MNRTSLLLIACLLSLAIAAGPFGPCPMNCLCTGIVPGGCTKCKDAHGDVATQCKTCMEGYGMNGEGTCVAQTPPTKPICPSACECRGFVPWTCTSCKDVNANLSTNCSECKTGFVHNFNGDCVDSNPQSRTCPSYCVCNGFVPWSCTRCPDQKKTLQSKCTQCIDGYALNRKTKQCVSLSPCPQGCNCSGKNPAGCVGCLKTGFDPLTKCRKCLPDYTYHYDSYSGYADCRPICSKGCTCVNPGGCDGCIDSMLAVLETKCTTCKPGYTMRPQGTCYLDPTPTTPSPSTGGPGRIVPPGGINPQAGPQSTPGFDVVNTYVLSQHPELVGAKVTKVSTQIVAGTNYYITYETATAKYHVVVWQKTWENFIQITTFTSSPK